MITTRENHELKLTTELKAPELASASEPTENKFVHRSLSTSIKNVNCMAGLADGNVAIGSNLYPNLRMTSAIDVFNLHTDRCIAHAEIESQIISLASSLDGTFWSLHRDHRIRHWTLRYNGKLICDKESLEIDEESKALAILDDHTIVISSNDVANTLSVLNTNTVNNINQKITLEKLGGVYTVRMNSLATELQGSVILQSSHQQLISRYNPTDGKCLASIHHKCFISGTNNIAILPNHQIAGINEHMSICLFNLSDLSVASILPDFGPDLRMTHITTTTHGEIFYCKHLESPDDWNSTNYKFGLIKLHSIEVYFETEEQRKNTIRSSLDSRLPRVLQDIICVYAQSYSTFFKPDKVSHGIGPCRPELQHRL